MYASARIALAILLLTQGLSSASTAQQPTLPPEAAKADSLFRSLDYAGALPLYEKLVQQLPKAWGMWNRLGMAHAHAGEAAKAAAAFETAAVLGNAPVAIYNAGALNARLGRADTAFVWLMRAAETGKIPLHQYETDEDLKGLRSDKRFADLLELVRQPHKP